MDRASRVAEQVLGSREAAAAAATTTGFQYTRDETAPAVLTAAERAFYEKNGYLIVKGNVRPERLDVYERRFQDICTEKVERQMSMTVMRDVALKGVRKVGENSITKLQDWQDDEVLFQYCKEPEVLRYVEAFTGPNIKSIHTMFINKPPDVGGGSSRHPLHQDLYYFPFRPANKIVCAWTAMERVTPENGCLVVIPGSHREPLLPHEYPEWEGGVNKMYHGIPKDRARVEERVHVIMDKGDTVFFHPLIIHGSGMNKSQGFRKAISCHYASGDCTFVDVDGTVQTLIRDEIQSVAKHKTGMDISFYDTWRLKSRLIRGKQAEDWELFGKEGLQGNLAPVSRQHM